MTDDVDTRGGRSRRVDVRAALLVALSSGPANGLELMGRIEQFSGGSWKPGATVVYPTLQQLDDEGLVAATDVDGKRVFTITADGEATARQLVVDGGVPWPQPDVALRRDLLREVGAFTLAAKKLAGTAGPDQIAAAIEVTQQARQRLLDAVTDSSPS